MIDWVTLTTQLHALMLMERAKNAIRHAEIYMPIPDCPGQSFLWS